MARRRALIAGLGTTGVLVALALLLLAVVGALLAFRGWPGDGVVDDADGLSLDGARLVAAPPPSFAGVVPPGAGNRAGPRRRVSRRLSGGRSGDRQSVAGVGRSGESGSGSGGAAGDSAPGLPRPASRRGSEAVGEELARTVEGVTNGTGSLGDVAAPVGDLVRQTGSAVSQTVRELGAKAEANAKQP